VVRWERGQTWTKGLLANVRSGWQQHAYKKQAQTSWFEPVYTLLNDVPTRQELYSHPPHLLASRQPTICLRHPAAHHSAIHSGERFWL